MKKLFTLGLLIMGLSSNAQTRVSLYEEFTGENCGPCASTNPGLNALLAQPSSTPLVIPIKWQVDIPSAPSTTWSLFQTDAAEISWRAYTYGYGINSAPSGRLDGQNPMTFGAASDHPADLTGATLASSASYTTPFTITMSPVWDATFSNAVVSVTIQSSQTFTASGSLIYRMVLVERMINFATAPGSNGEKDFEDAVRKSYPTIQAGTSLPGTWTVGQSQTFTIACAIPSYIVDKAQMAFVGFVQDDGNKKVWQAARTSPVAIPNDAKLTTVTVPSYSCSTSLNPSINILNQGSNAITGMTITPSIDGVAQTPVTWSGSLASASNTTILLGSYAAAAGSHTLSVNITNVSGGDVNTANNTKSSKSALIQSYFAAPLIEAFGTTTFPPTNWFVINTDQGVTWSRSGGTGFNGVGAAKYPFYNNGVTGDADEMFVTPSDLTGMPVPMLSFDVAYAQYSNDNDKLEVKVSTNCGSTWTTIFSKSGATLKTVPPQTAAFTPNANSQWRNELISLPAGAANNASVLVKFIATSDYGNNMYLDNINIANNLTVIKTHNAEMFSVQLYPNPSSEFSNLDITSKTAVKANVTVYNSIGQKVIEKNVQLNEGYNNTVIDTKLLSTGVYNVVLSSEAGNSVKKLTVTK